MGLIYFFLKYTVWLENKLLFIQIFWRPVVNLIKQAAHSAYAMVFYEVFIAFINSLIIFREGDNIAPISWEVKNG